MSEFINQYNQVVVDEGIESMRIRGRYPFHASKWIATNKAYLNAQETHGELLRATLLSGGCLHMPFSVYWSTLELKAKDIECGTVCTDVEIAHNCEGIRLFFELDYRTSTRVLPSLQDTMPHLSTIYEAVCDCFPSLTSSPVMHISTCTPKRKQKRSSNTIELSWGIHIIFPGIVTTTQIMRKIAQVIDIRLSKLFPDWPAIVDSAPYRADSGTLRPCFSYKMVDCGLCIPEKTLHISKRKRDWTDQQSDIQQQVSMICDCFKGRRVDPSVYTYVGSITRRCMTITPLLTSVLEVLKETSIIPTSMGLFTTCFEPTPDMGGDLDRIPTEPSMFPAEKRVISGINRRKDMISVDIPTYPDAVRTIHRIISRLDGEYVHTAIHRLSLDRNKSIVIVLPKGKGARYCLTKGAHHHSNRVYFTMYIKRGKLDVQCFDQECKKERIVHTFPLAMIDKLSLIKNFGLDVSKTKPAEVPDKRERWMQQVRAYENQNQVAI